MIRSGDQNRLHVTTGYQWYGLQPSYNATGAAGETFEGKLLFQTTGFQQIAQLDAFAQDVRNGRAPEASGREGLIDLKIIEAVVKAANTGKRVTLEHV